MVGRTQLVQELQRISNSQQIIWSAVSDASSDLRRPALRQTLGENVRDRRPAREPLSLLPEHAQSVTTIHFSRSGTSHVDKHSASGTRSEDCRSPCCRVGVSERMVIGSGRAFRSESARNCALLCSSLLFGMAIFEFCLFSVSKSQIIVTKTSPEMWRQPATDVGSLPIPNTATRFEEFLDGREIADVTYRIDGKALERSLSKAGLIK